MTDQSTASAPPAATGAPPTATATPPSAVATPPSTLLGAEAPKTAETRPAGEAPKTAAGAPEKYADFTMPEGVTVDATALANFTPALKSLDLTQEQAQQLVNVYATENQRQVTEFAKSLENPQTAVQQAGLMLNGHRDAWASQIKADKDIGGANFDANVQTAQRALARFGTPELKELLNTTGLGNHPELVRMFVAVGKQIREDNPQYGSTATGRKPTHEVFYGGNAASGA
jgi:hypothetical protein